MVLITRYYVVLLEQQDATKRICWNNYTSLYGLSSDDYASLYGFIRNTIRHYAEQGVKTIRHHVENEPIMQHYAE